MLEREQEMADDFYMRLGEERAAWEREQGASEGERQTALKREQVAVDEVTRLRDELAAREEEVEGLPQVIAHCHRRLEAAEFTEAALVTPTLATPAGAEPTRPSRGFLARLLRR